MTWRELVCGLAGTCALFTLLYGAHVQAQNAQPLVPRGSEKPSFDCSKAKTASARIICADGELARLDGQLGASFQKRKSEIPATEQQKFIADQVAWIRERNNQCALTGKDNAAIEVLATSKPCMVSAIQDRIATLSQMAQATGDRKPASLAGTFGSLSFDGQYTVTTTESSTVYRIKALTLHFVADAQFNRVDLIQLTSFDLVATKKNGDKTVLLLRRSLPLSVPILDISSPTVTINEAEFEVPQSIMDDADHVGFSVTDGKMLWPVPTELKISKPDLVAKSDTNSQKKLQWAFELAKERPQALAALQRILPPNYTDTPWVYNLAATSGPIFEITRNGTSYLTGEVCKPHDCRDNLFGFIVAGNGSRAVAATRISGKQSLYGQPTPAEINVLTNLIDWAYDGGNNTSPAQQQTVLQQIIEGLPPQPVQALPPQQTQGAPLSGQMTCINGYQDYFWYTATMSMAEAQQNLSNRASTISFLNDVRNRGKAFCARERASGRCCGPSAYPNNIRIQVNANNIIQLVATGDLIGDWNIDNAFDRVIQSPPAMSQSGEPWPNSAGFAEQSNGDAPTEAEATQCVRAALASANQCSGFLTIDGIRQIDRRADQGSAEVIMEVDFTVAKSFEACSPIAAACTGTCWKQNTNVQYQTSNFGVGENYFKVGARLRSHKSFIFQKFESGWRCQTKTLQPVSESFFLN